MEHARQLDLWSCLKLFYSQREAGVISLLWTVFGAAATVLDRVDTEPVRQWWGMFRFNILNPWWWVASLGLVLALGLHGAFRTLKSREKAWMESERALTVRAEQELQAERCRLEELLRTEKDRAERTAHCASELEIARAQAADLRRELDDSNGERQRVEAELSAARIREQKLLITPEVRLTRFRRECDKLRVRCQAGAGHANANEAIQLARAAWQIVDASLTDSWAAKVRGMLSSDQLILLARIAGDTDAARAPNVNCDALLEIVASWIARVRERVDESSVRLDIELQ